MHSTKTKCLDSWKRVENLRRDPNGYDRGKWFDRTYENNFERTQQV